MALKEAIKHIKEDLVMKIDPKDTELLRHVAETSLSSKLIGPESKFFSEIVVNAITSSKIMVGDTPKYSVKNINILKTHGKSVTESRLIDGYAIESTRGGMGMPLTIKNAKIALLDMNLAKFRMPPGVHIMVDNPDNLENVRQREMDVTKERCRKIIEAGANVIVCSKGIDDLALKYFVEAKCIAIRRCDKADMKRLASATGAKILITFESKDEDEEEIFNKECLGEAKEVSEEAVNDYNYVFFKQCKNQKAQTILLRGANYLMLDEAERSIHDALCAVKRVLESKTLVIGGGCVEVSTSLYLENFARSLGSREQMAINEYAEALNVIPKQLAINAAKDATDLLTKLRYVHSRYLNATEHNENTDKLKNTGLDLMNGKIRNNYKAGVFEPAISKVKSLKFATEAAITILRIDDLIRIEPEKQPKGPK